MDYGALERLVRLRDQGALSAEEFAEQKRLLLNGQDFSSAETSSIRVRLSRYAPLQKISAGTFVVGLCIVLYSSFVYDTTISPMEFAGPYPKYNGDLAEMSRSVSDLADRFERAQSGERIINFPRVEEQRRMFSFGALLMILSAIGFVAPNLIARHGRVE